MAWGAKVASEQIDDVQKALDSAQIEWYWADSSFVPPPGPSGQQQQAVRTRINWPDEQEAMGKLEFALKGLQHQTTWDGPDF